MGRARLDWLTMLLFRPTGLVELKLVLQQGLRGWPPRLRDQPIFYPVLNLGYAEQIARDWNTKSDERVGYATRFSVDDAYASQFERRVVGGKEHEELWVPAEELASFNEHLLGPIEVVSAFFGEGFRGLTPQAGLLQGKQASEQLKALATLVADEPGGVRAEVILNRDAIFLHLPFWKQSDLSGVELLVPAEQVLARIETVWQEVFPDLPLPRLGGEHSRREVLGGF
jgi:hypothetical protein